MFTPFDAAHDVWNWMDELGLKKKRRHYYYMVNMFCRKGDLNVALDLRSEMKEKLRGGDRAVDTLLAGYLADEGYWDELEELIEDGHIVMDQ